MFLLATSCLPATRNAAVRREAESRLAFCLDWGNDTNMRYPITRMQCVKESVDFCKDNGLEVTCATDGYWTWKRSPNF